MDRRSAAVRDRFGALLLLAASMIAGCTAQPKIDTNYHAVSQDSRVQFIMLHYTEIDFSRSLHRLTKEEVSSHYLVDDQPTTIYWLVEENQWAWHAGR
jgi:N-acetylmuramoyl-L-alanine amidase